MPAGRQRGAPPCQLAAAAALWTAVAAAQLMHALGAPLMHSELFKAVDDKVLANQSAQRK